MAYLNANLPPIYCKVRKEYLYDLKEHHGESEDCVIFGLTSISGRALLFNIMLPNGACFWRLPISAFFQKSYDRANVPNMQTHELELWNCFSYWPSVHRFDWLAGLSGKFLGLDKKFYHGKYLFTIDWGHPDTNILDTEHSEIPQEHKCAHILELITAILQLSLIIVFCGTLIVLLLTQVGLTIKCKLHTGMRKILTW
jgi:hypothetical protein